MTRGDLILIVTWLALTVAAMQVIMLTGRVEHLETAVAAIRVELAGYD